MFVLDLLLLTCTPMIFPDPGMQRVFIHSQVSRGLGNRLIRLDRQFHCAFLECSGILFRSGLTHRTHLLGCVLSLISVCPEEYSHTKTSRSRHKLRTGNSARCSCIQAYFTAAVAQSTPRPFLRYLAPPLDGRFLSAGASVPHTDVRHGPPSPGAPFGDISQSRYVTCFHSPQGRAPSVQSVAPT